MKTMRLPADEAVPPNAVDADGSARAGLAAAKAGAACYILWGVWHLRVAWNGYAATLGMPLDPVPLRLQQNAFHILFFALAAIGIGMMLNWRNSRLGYWANLVVIGWTELGLLLIFVQRGAFPWLPTGFIGPLLWVAAVALTTYAYRAAPGPKVP